MESRSPTRQRTSSADEPDAPSTKQRSVGVRRGVAGQGLLSLTLLVQALRKRNEELAAAIARLGNELRKAKAEIKDLRETKASLEKQLDASEKVLMGG
jgi:chromosome segregation ATPase